jgi:hypothetical protein
MWMEVHHCFVKNTALEKIEKKKIKKVFFFCIQFFDVKVHNANVTFTPIKLITKKYFVTIIYHIILLK